LNQACQFGLRQGLIKTNPVAGVLLPEARPAKERNSLTIEQVEQVEPCPPNRARPLVERQGRYLMLVALPEDTGPSWSLTLSSSASSGCLTSFVGH
jgi:hypothetical protein